MQTASLIFGILSIVGMIIGFVPCLGSLNWLNIPFAAVGLVISIIAVAQESTNKSKAVTGLTLCIIAIVFGIVRLIIGGGIV